jgi:hypothetical protein
MDTHKLIQKRRIKLSLLGLARLTMAIAFLRRDYKFVRRRAEQQIDRGKLRKS